MSGLVFIISGPSGVGKSTLRKEVMSCCDSLKYSVSYTTRPPRRGEQDGIDYTFISHDVFTKMKEEGKFAEWARVHGNYYGTPREPILRWTEEGLDVILEIDVQGAMQVKNSFPEEVFIFIAPPSLTDLERRLRWRKTDQEDDILLRMTNAHLELDSIRDYNYLIVNDRLEEAVKKFHAIIIAERCRIR